MENQTGYRNRQEELAEQRASDLQEKIKSECESNYSDQLELFEEYMHEHGGEKLFSPAGLYKIDNDKYVDFLEPLLLVLKDWNPEKYHALCIQPLIDFHEDSPYEEQTPPEKEDEERL